MSLRVSEHARTRWLERTADARLDPHGAWLEATPVRRHGLDGDEVRYHDPSSTVLIRKDDTLVTVISLDDATYSVHASVQHLRGEQR
ncbi:hypothetical protein [Halobaculum sp. P14]|uniref:hypothetical protein n=1 Tax=Halobaculum sp. P14 TaxID=3421638 RepID=UPI003EB89455